MVTCNSSYVSPPTPQLILPLQITYPIATTDKLTGMLMPYQTLTECLNGFFGTECVETSTCVDCKNDGKFKTIRIFEISLVIFIQLKQFNSQNEKLTIPIKFEPKLNLNRYLGSDRLSSLSDYLLYAVILHYGSGVRNGHYVICVLSDNNNWKKIDDHQVTNIDIDDVLKENENAYILGYVRHATTCTELNTETHSTFNNEPKNLSSTYRDSTGATAIGSEENLLGKSENNIDIDELYYSTTLSDVGCLRQKNDVQQPKGEPNSVSADFNQIDTMRAGLGLTFDQENKDKEKSCVKAQKKNEKKENQLNVVTLNDEPLNDNDQFLSDHETGTSFSILSVL
ncbi:unnamed protein product [Didymodactylos carnosus]|uniref:ubiquitinyl hydrolase 1 n=1 Tax=Didymodactylos carnosus TaxID=1234261 RepID=A0A814LG98_9BILA|nr:unnamed protein product [Didymodactylos carnosus]CAF1063865.1 unnamed protein product [Didymodactylos carnosus]CAF3712998.1 unnamed protein product [Didymodactylos carnosus]CAF3831883.1 unnamed protein product [Didymodactylos carnosus]